jgi:hypothetical protein
MAVGDMLFMELVASDLVVNCCVRLNIFNGFMARDEDLHALVCIMDLEKLTGRGTLSADAVRRESMSPLRSSRRLTRSTNGRSSSLTSKTGMPSDIVLAELAMLRELQKNWQKTREEYQDGLGALVAALGEQEEAAKIALRLQNLVGRRDSSASLCSVDSQDLQNLLADGSELSRRSSKSSKVSVDAVAVVIEDHDEATASNPSQDQSTVATGSRNGEIFETDILHRF